MNCDTGELRKLMPFTTEDERIFQMRELEETGYTLVPQGLEAAAKRKLSGKTEATVSLNSGGKLSKWAAQERKKKRQKMAKESKKRNR
jgi:hypothetical protein